MKLGIKILLYIEFFLLLTFSVKADTKINPLDIKPNNIDTQMFGSLYSARSNLQAQIDGITNNSDIARLSKTNNFIYRPEVGGIGVMLQGEVASASYSNVLGSIYDSVSASNALTSISNVAQSASDVAGSNNSWIANNSNSVSSSLQPNRYLDLGDGTVFDSKTGLNWDLNTDHGLMTWAAAVTYIDALNTAVYKDHRDWRLPQVNEQDGLTAKMGVYEIGTIDCNDLGNYSYPSAPFTNSAGINSMYWSVITVSNNTLQAWVQQNSGKVKRAKTQTAHVWPVRGGTPIASRGLVVVRTNINVNGFMLTNGIYAGDGLNLTNIPASSITGGILTNGAAFATAAQGVKADTAYALTTLDTNLNSRVLYYEDVGSNISSVVTNYYVDGASGNPNLTGVYMYYQFTGPYGHHWIRTPQSGGIDRYIYHQANPNPLFEFASAGGYAGTDPSFTRSSGGVTGLYPVVSGATGTVTVTLHSAVTNWLVYTNIAPARSAITNNTADFATAAQGAKADTAIQIETDAIALAALVNETNRAIVAEARAVTNIINGGSSGTTGQISRSGQDITVTFPAGQSGVAFTASNNVFTGSNTFNGAVNMNSNAITLVSSLGFTNGEHISGSVVWTNGTGAIGMNPTFVTVTGSHIGDGSGLTNLNGVITNINGIGFSALTNEGTVTLTIVTGGDQTPLTNDVNAAGHNITGLGMVVSSNVLVQGMYLSLTNNKDTIIINTRNSLLPNTNTMLRSTYVGHDVGSGAGGTEDNGFGYRALISSAGSYNIGVGNFAGGYSAGSYNTSVGNLSGYYSLGSYNVSIGSYTGFRSGGLSNVFIGVNAGSRIPDPETNLGVTNCICLGANVKPKGSSTIAIGLASATTYIDGSLIVSNGISGNGAGLTNVWNLGTPSVYIYASTNMGIANATETVIPMTNIFIDTHSGYNTNTLRYVCPINYPGYYNITGMSTHSDPIGGAMVILHAYEVTPSFATNLIAGSTTIFPTNTQSIAYGTAGLMMGTFKYTGGVHSVYITVKQNYSGAAATIYGNDRSRTFFKVWFERGL